MFSTPPSHQHEASLRPAGCLSSTICLPLIGRLGRRAPNHDSKSCQPGPVHTLNDDALLNIFYLYQLDIPDEYGGYGELNAYWGRQRWWYKLAQVCRRWRYLILASPSRLDLHLLCTICYGNFGRETSDEDEEGILLALRHSDRVHYIALNLPPPKLQKIITTMDEQFPILERIYLWTRTDGASFVLPRTFQAPHLRHLSLWPAALPIGSPLLTTTVGLVTLALVDIPQSAYFSPTYLLTRLSLMPQLEILEIHFYSPLPNRDVKRQLLHTQIITHITLPNLRWFSFKGVSAYLEGLLALISAPVLSVLRIQLFSQLTFTVPRLLQFIDTSEILSFNAVQLAFHTDFAQLVVFQLGEQRRYPFSVQIKCRHLDWQVSSTAQILDTLQPVLSVVEELILSHEEHNLSSEWHNEVDRTQWRQLLRPFSNMKTLRVQNEFVGKLARSLQSDDGEPPLELLPNLREVRYSGDNTRNAFTPFSDERQVAGHPVDLTTVDHSEFLLSPWP